ncbi:hypothetical protein GJ496_007338 [Pomphorhynchus laevis]|nr:hypothetical protein GJ496_007338 [Pomphorhynchus laevis]
MQSGMFNDYQKEFQKRLNKQKVEKKRLRCPVKENKHSYHCRDILMDVPRRHVLPTKCEQLQIGCIPYSSNLICKDYLPIWMTGNISNFISEMASERNRSCALWHSRYNYTDREKSYCSHYDHCNAHCQIFSDIANRKLDTQLHDLEDRYHTSLLKHFTVSGNAEYCCKGPVRPRLKHIMREVCGPSDTGTAIVKLSPNFK